MNQHVAPDERIDPETGEITKVSPSTEITVAQVEAPGAEAAAVEAVAVPDAEKRKFPVQPVLKETEPSLPTPAADRIDDNWGIARYATRGAMHLERYFVMSEKLLWPSILLALLSILLIINAFSGMSSGSMSLGGSEWRGPIRFLTMVLPFLFIGVAVTVLAVQASGVEYDNMASFYAGGGLISGFGLMIFWMYAADNPNGIAAWIIALLKIAVAIGIFLWIGRYLIKLRRSKESKAVLWGAGAYVGFVVIASVALTSFAGALSGFAPGGMQGIASLLTFDEDTYFDLGGGLRSGPEYRWMSEYAPKGGLSVAKHNALIASVRSDLSHHSNDAASWTEVTKLDPQPMITRPEKVIRDNAKELPNGVVVIPEDNSPLSVVAHVAGQWSITVIVSRQCAVVLGPFDPATGCENETTPAQPLNGYVRRIIDTIKPTLPAETKE